MTCKTPISDYAVSAQQATSAAIAQLPSFEQLTNYQNDPVSRLNSVSIAAATVATQSIVAKHSLQDYPQLNERVTQSMLTPAEIGDFAIEFGYTGEELQELTEDLFSSVQVTPGTIPADEIDVGVSNYLQQLEFYYTSDLGPAVTYGVCSIFGAVGFVFANLDTIKNGVSKLTELRNFSSADALNVLNRLSASLKSAVQQMFTKFKTQITNIVNNTITKINQTAVNVSEAFKRMNKAAAEAKEFFTDANLQSVQDSIEKRLAGIASQFQDVDVEKVAFIMFRACKLASELESFIKRPVDGLKTLIEGFEVAEKIFKTGDYRESLNSVVNGNWRITPEERKARVEAAASRINGRGGITAYPSINIPMSETEMRMVSDLTEDGNEFFEFSRNVKDMGLTAQIEFQNSGILEYWDDTQNQEDAGWKYIAIHRPEVFVKLSRVAKRLGKQLLVTSAYRSPWYNLIYQRRILGNTGASQNSMHMYGNALDIHVPDGLVHADLIRAASLEGFDGIGIYNTFVHMDTNSARRTWVQKSELTEQERQYLLAHSGDKFRKGLA